MQRHYCARCHKNLAVIFITKIENGVSTNEGYCLKCARELNIKPVDDVIKKMGLSDEELDNLTDEMMEAVRAMDENSDDGDLPADPEEAGRTATFPFLNKLFGGDGGPGMPPPPQQGRGEPVRPNNDQRERTRKKAKYLDTYCNNLNLRAQEGKLDRLIGRKEEIERVIQILNRRQKNNPCLIGEPGVGKTAIAEGLAKRIYEKDVPYKLLDKEVYLLDLTSLVAGTQFRGQFEGRMKGLIEEIKERGNIILVIDEVHNLVGAGDAEGSMNAANILKPALSRGEIQVIGATTFAEYRKHIEKDSALERRFQPVTVNEPSIAESIDIIMGIRDYYEKFHTVRIPDEIARQAVLLSERYITDRFLPDKAIDLIDEACSDVNLKDRRIAEYGVAKKELADIDKTREVIENDTTRGPDYEKLAQLRSQSLQLQTKVKAFEDEGWPELTIDNLARVIELWTKIPASSIKEDEFKRLAELDKRLKKHIVGQDQAVDTVCAAIRRNRIGIAAKRKPVSFIFTGSTGVGKTELVKRLAEDMFDSPESLIRFDMTEFMEKHTVSRLIGSPPGYVGYDEAGQLTEKIRRKPYSVVLFDEIEKAHPDVLNILLQILDDGRVTDAHGRVVNFENTVIIMTTNAGSEKHGGGTVGFGGTSNDQNREKTMKALNDFLRPEFINRVDAVVFFNRLTEEDFRGIAGIMLEELRQSMAEKNIALTWDESVIDYLVKKAYSLTYGARNLRRCIQNDIEDAIANEIIANYQTPVSKVGVSVRDEKIVVLGV